MSNPKAASEHVRTSALVGGGAATIVFMGTFWAVGSVGDRQALHLLEATLPTIRFLCSSVIAAGATVLALMLTLLSLSQSMEGEFDVGHFKRIEHIAGLCVLAVIGGLSLLVLLCVPIGESSELRTWYSVVYYVMLVLSSLLGGLVVATMLALRTAVIGLVRTASPHHETPSRVDHAAEER